MIEILIKLLEITESKHELVDIAKGKYAIPMNYAEAKEQYKMRQRTKN